MRAVFFRSFGGLAAVALLYGLRIFLRFRGHIARETG